jgi:hypothetical protein
VIDRTVVGSIKAVGRKLVSVAAAAAVVIGIVVGGCGSSSHTIASSGPVALAADTTAHVPGYKLAGVVSVSTPAGPATTSMSGAFDRTNRTGELTSTETVAGHRLNFTEVFSALTFYLRAAGIPQMTRLTGGKPWLKFDMSRLLGAMGLGSLPTGTDPSQFVDYLRAVSSSTTRVGSAVVRGVDTTHYHAVIDLARYPDLVPQSQRAAAARGISTLEDAVGGHSLPIDVWIGHDNLVRRISLGFAECVANQRLRVGMTMDLYDYGPQKPTNVPSADQAYDITPLLTSTLGKIKFGCAASS